MEIVRVIGQAFPSRLAEDASVITRHLCAMPHGSATHWFKARVGDEQLEIPERISFHHEHYRRVGLSIVQSDMIDCLHTRNHDGFVRQRAFDDLRDLNAPWVIPFVVRLMGDYVVEILQSIYVRLPEIEPKAYQLFLNDNERFAITTRSRIVSYWSAYHRLQPANRSDYVGFQLLARIGQK